MRTEPSEQSRLLNNEDRSIDNVENGHNHKKKTQRTVNTLQGHDLYLALAFPYLGQLLSAIDVTMTSTVSATIASDFSSLSIVSWLGSAYLVSLAAIQPLSGKLTDRYGRRPGLLLALICFAVGNLMCGVAQSTFTLIIGRIVAGIGGGAMSSITAFVTTDLVTLRKRTVWQGFGDVLWAIGMGLGGVVGGGINDLIGWRWAFLALTPLTILVIIGAYFTLILPEDHHSDESIETKTERIDIAGAITLTIAIISLILGLNIAEKGNALIPSGILSITGVLLLIAFIIIELKHATSPIIPIHLLTNRSVLGSCLSGLLVSVSMYTLLFYVPLLIQVRGYTTTQVGLQLLGEPLGASTGSPFTGLAMNIIGGYTLIKPIVFLVYLAAPLGFTLSNLDTPPWITILTLVAMGSGFGSFLTVVFTGLLANTDHRVQATVTGMLYAFRQVGASTGLAISGILFRYRVAEEMNGRYFNHDYSSNSFHTRALENIAKECDRRKFIGGTGGGRPQTCVAYGDALHTVFLFATVAGALGVFFGMFIRNVSLDREDDRLVVHHNDDTGEGEGDVSTRDGAVVTDTMAGGHLSSEAS